MAENHHQSVSMLNCDSNKMYTFQRPRQQPFSVPFPIIKYFFTNPSTRRAWKKLIKTCKFFFSKNHLYPVEYLISLPNGKSMADGFIFDANKSIFKSWLFDEMQVYHTKITNAVSLLIPKIFKCELRKLRISDQILTLKEYQFLTSSGTIEILEYWRDMSVKHADGTTITCDKLIENLQRLQNFEMNGSNNSELFGLDANMKMAEHLQKLKNLQICQLYNLPKTFDISFFVVFIRKNKRSATQFKYSREAQLSDVHKMTLEESLAKILANPPAKLPMIYLPGFAGPRYLEYLRKKSLSN